MQVTHSGPPTINLNNPLPTFDAPFEVNLLSVPKVGDKFYFTNLEKIPYILDGRILKSIHAIIKYELITYHSKILYVGHIESVDRWFFYYPKEKSLLQPGIVDKGRIISDIRVMLHFGRASLNIPIVDLNKNTIINATPPKFIPFPAALKDGILQRKRRIILPPLIPITHKTSAFYPLPKIAALKTIVKK